MKLNVSKILSYIVPSLKKYPISGWGVIFAYSFAVIFDSILKPYIFKEIIDTFTSSADKTYIIARVMYLILVMVVVVIAHNIGFRVGDYLNSYFQSKVMRDLYDYTFNKLLTHSYGFFTNNFSGSLVAKTKRFSKQFETLADIITFQLLFSFITLSGVLVVLFLKARILSYIFFIWTILYILITILFIKYKIKFDLREAEADSLVTARLSDALLNVFNIKIFSSDKREKAGFRTVIDKEEVNRRHAWYFGNFQNAVQAGLMAVLQVVVLYASLYLWEHDQITLGLLVLLQLYMFNLFDILWNLGRSLTKGVKALTDMKEVVDIFELVPDIQDIPVPKPLVVSSGAVGFHNVSFSYTDGIEVLKNMQLQIAPGERVGLVGHSGAGKSTITKLLLRFADTNSGYITIDGQNIAEVTQNDLRNHIGYVPQESILFHRTIGENIAYGSPDASLEQIISVAKKAHAHEFISKLPFGYDTLVGERGVKLSGGERQRIAIARAMLKNAPILILDEATSSLDSVSESYIQDAFQELMHDKTTIVIAHRLSTIQKMDRIIVVENGAITEEGTHKQLIAQKGIYAHLWKSQSGGFIEE